MSRSRLILLSLLAAFVVGAVATASATEPPKKCGGKVMTTPNYCVGGVQLENSKGESISEKIEGPDGESVLKTTVGNVNTEIKCTKGKSTGTIENGTSGTVGKSKAKITLETCKLLKPANCKLTAAEESAIKTTELKGALALTGGRIEDKLEPKEGAAFASISIEGENVSCVIAEPGKPETYAVTGSQLCEVDSSNTEAETETEKHKLICKFSGSSLKIGENKAEMSSEATVALSGAKAHGAWSVKEHT